MTIFEAKPYDPAKERRKEVIIAAAVLAAIVIGIVAYLYRNWPEERVVARFFDALVAKDYEKAYGIWLADPNWKRHPGKYPQYTFHEFSLDWGPGGEWGIIHNYHIDGSANPKQGSGVVVQITVNDRHDKARIWVEKKDKTLTFSPY